MTNKYNTAFSVSFSISHSHEDPYDIPIRDLVRAMRKRADDLEFTDEIEAFEAWDTYEIPEIPND